MGRKNAKPAAMSNEQTPLLKSDGDVVGTGTPGMFYPKGRIPNIPRVRQEPRPVTKSLLTVPVPDEQQVFPRPGPAMLPPNHGVRRRP